MTCKDCIHYNVCQSRIAYDENFGLSTDITDIESRCDDFKKQSCFLELPCEIGTKVFRVLYINTPDDEYYMSYSKEWVVRQGCFTLSDLSSFGKTVFCTEEEAQIALYKSQNKSTV